MNAPIELADSGPAPGGAADLYADALAYARARELRLPADYYADRRLDARAWAFSVSGLSQLDQIQGVLDSLNAAIDKGGTLKAWQDGVRSGAIKLDLPRHRLETIFRTNVQQAYNAGRTAQQHRNLKRRPYFLYDAINDSRTRPAHRAMDGFIARHDDPIWATRTPPMGLNCRCKRIALSEAQAKARGLNTQGAPPNVQPDPGWDYDRREGWRESLRRAVDRRRGRIDERLSSMLERMSENTFRQPEFDPPWYDAKAERQSPDVSTPARKAAVALEDAIRLDAAETGAFIDSDGSLLIKRKGRPDRVGFSARVMSRMAGKVFTHNHPNGASFSAEDVVRAVEAALGELRVVTPSARFRLSAPNGWPDVLTLIDTYDQALAEAADRTRDLLSTGRLYIAHAALEQHHLRWVIVSRILGLDYVREGS